MGDKNANLILLIIRYYTISIHPSASVRLKVVSMHKKRYWNVTFFPSGD